MRNKYSFETIFLGLCLLFFLMATVGLFIRLKNNLFSYFHIFIFLYYYTNFLDILVSKCRQAKSTLSDLRLDFNKRRHIYDNT